MEKRNQVNKQIELSGLAIPISLGHEKCDMKHWQYVVGVLEE